MKINKFAGIHHLIFSLCPILFLYFHNSTANVGAPRIMFYCLISLCLSEIVYLSIKIVLKGKLKASTIASAFLILIFFFPYAIVFDKLTIELSIPVLLLSLISFIVIYFIVLTTQKDLRKLTTFLNLSSLLLILIIIMNGIYTSFERKKYKDEKKNKIGFSIESHYPDIYYIVLDGYARNDILQELYGYNNNQFIASLRQRGFFVANKSRANYNLTIASLASSLNFQYLDEISKKIGENSSDKQLLLKMIRNSRIRDYLSARGYGFVCFSSGYSDTEIKDCDNIDKDSTNSWAGIAEFESILLHNSLMGAVLKKYLTRQEYETHKIRVNRTFDQLVLAGNQAAPVFVFAHIMAPHPPFIFSGDTPLTSSYIFTDGSELHHNKKELRQNYISGYRDQVTALNKKILVVIDRVLNEAKRATIIIIQADHGPRLFTDWSNPISGSDLNESMGILNAFYVPGITKSRSNELSDRITPVNTFRLILKNIFSEKMELLDDKSFAVYGIHKPYKHIPYN